MAEVLNKRSDQVQASGIPTVPLASQMKYGELALNYANGAETMFIKNSNDDIVSFSNDNALIKYIDDNSIEYIVGTQTGTTAAWTGVTKSTELKTGKTIAYRLTQTSASNVTLNLTLPNGTTTGAKPVYYSGDTRMTTHYAKNSVIILTYDGAGWRHCDYNTNTTYSVISDSELQTGTATTGRTVSAARLKANYNITGRTIKIGANTIDVPLNELSENYEMSSLESNITLEEGDTYEEAFGKLEKAILNNELVTSHSLNNLDQNIQILIQDKEQLEQELIDDELIIANSLSNLNQNVQTLIQDKEQLQQELINDELVISNALNILDQNIQTLIQDKEQLEQELINDELVISNFLNDLNTNKQDKLESGVNIKTINNQSLLDEGNLDLAPINSPQLIGTPTAPTATTGTNTTQLATTEFVNNSIDKINEYTIYTDQEFTKRVVGDGIADISSGVAKINRIKGNTIAYKQLVGSGTESSTLNGVTYTRSGHTFTFSGTSAAAGSVGKFFNADMISGHKYFIHMKHANGYTMTSGGVGFYSGTADCFVYNCTATGTKYLQIYAPSANLPIDITFDFYYIDLTLMFGVGNEPTAEQFQKWFPLSYYSYEATGKLINFTASELRCIKYDLPWTQKIINGNFENGINNWANYGESTTISVQDKKLKVVVASDNQGALQGLTCNLGDKYYVSYYIDSPVQGNFLLYKASNIWGTTTPINIGTNHCYSLLTVGSNQQGYSNLIFRFPKGGYTYYLYNVLFINLTEMFGKGNEPTNISEIQNMLESLNNPITNLEYDKNNTFGSAEINVTTITGKVNGEGNSVVIFSNGMKSVGTVYDEIYNDNGIWKAIKRVEQIGNLGGGSINWTNQGNNIYTSPNGGTSLKTNSQIITTSTKYIKSTVTNINTGFPVNGINIISGGRIMIRDESFTDATTASSLLNGISLSAELETPITYILDSNIQDILNIYENGYEVIIPENTSTVTTSPAIFDIQYGMNINEQFKELNFRQSNQPNIPQYVLCTLAEYNAMAYHDINTYYIIIENQI